MNLERLLELAVTTRLIRSGADLLRRVPEILDEALERAGNVADSSGLDAAADGRKELGPILIADENTWEAAGREVEAAFNSAGRPVSFVKLFPGSPPLKAEYRHVTALVEELHSRDGFVIAVGSGTVNDLVKLSCGEMKRPYGVVGTAASMDGYSSQGAAVLKEGLKQTLKCPAPVFIVADTQVLAEAPPGMSASGYADLAAKIPAGLDWILADRLGADPIDPVAWAMVHEGLEDRLAPAAGVGRGDGEALNFLFEGLTATGCSMQYYGESRPVAGGEHQFSHVLEMEGWQYKGRSPSHGFKVGVGSLASLRVFRELLAFLESGERLGPQKIEELVAAYPSLESELSEAMSLFGDSPALESVKAVLAEKRPSPDVLRTRLSVLERNREGIITDLKARMPDYETFRGRLAAAGAPSSAADIGLDGAKVVRTLKSARMIRNRYGGLDLAYELGLFDSITEKVGREI